MSEDLGTVGLEEEEVEEKEEIEDQIEAVCISKLRTISSFVVHFIIICTP